MDSQRKTVFVKTSQEGIELVMNGDYAFLMESTMIDYNVQRNCDLMQVGGLLDSKGYGIGTRIGNFLLSLVNSYSESKNPPYFSDIFFQNGRKFLVQILRAYYTFQSTLN